MRNSLDNVENVQGPSAWHRTALATAIVGAAFSFIVLVVICANYLQGVLIDTKLEKELENLKTQIRQQAGDEQLLSRIRQLDLRNRRNKVGRLDRSRKGSYLLAGGIVILLIGVKWAHGLRKTPPSPRKAVEAGTEQRRQAKLARRALAGGLATIAIGLVALLLASGPYLDFGRADSAAGSYPSAEELARNWPRFRGPEGRGVSAYTNMPTSWNGKTGEGILWKTAVPLAGHNSPVVWGDRIFLAGADPNERQVYCFDAVSGSLLWTGRANPAPKGNKEFEEYEGTGISAPTVVTDGRWVCAIFADGRVACFDFDGKEVWTKSLGVPDSSYGYASSLEMYRNLLLIQYDQGAAEDGKSSLMALNVLSGQAVWQVKRPVANSWTSPVVVKIGEKYQVVTCGDPYVMAYDPASGAEIWRAKCVTGDLAPSPIYTCGLVLAVEPYTRLVAIRPDGYGDVTKTHIAWSSEEGAPDICSPVSSGELVFMLTTEGLLTCHKLADGAKLWEKDLKVYFRASPSLVGGRLYLLSEKGVMFIAEAAGGQYKELARCELGEECHASPAFGDGRLYIRGYKNLYCIGQPVTRQP